ncbi:hypothetical protein L3Q72_22360 [Vibrio sp. JC009]|uniref:hypothetical protein n=1 Tax=Vibrio sp. JC009 TaxID=2912314 RepID=UPI0023B175BB|nr:hypothetical protein [Vibrio sp. JC009]WED23976.1 hypothetical protein L3Q72_22360 [Vibrio sp. JC009]
MEEQGTLYAQFFKAQDRFLNAHSAKMFDPEIIRDYVHWGMVIGNYYEQQSKTENLLLCELFLRQVYSHLLEAIRDKRHSMIFRRVCYDSIHTTFISLKRYYYHFEHGDESVQRLKYQLEQVVATMDY